MRFATYIDEFIKETLEAHGGEVKHLSLSLFSYFSFCEEIKSDTRMIHISPHETPKDTLVTYRGWVIYPMVDLYEIETTDASRYHAFIEAYNPCRPVKAMTARSNLFGELSDPQTFDLEEAQKCLNVLADECHNMWIAITMQNGRKHLVRQSF